MLTRKEIEVLRLIKAGHTQIEIAEKLNISQPAISGFKSKAYKKLRDAYRSVQIGRELGIAEGNFQ